VNTPNAGTVSSVPQLLVLDGQGVVFNNPFPAFLADLGVRTGVGEPEVTSRWSDELRLPFWTGQLSEAAMWARLAPGLSTTGLREDLERRYAPGPLYDLVRRSTARLWLLSNHRGDWLRPRLERFALTERFERILVSDEQGVAKPSPEAFAHLINTSCLYIDDLPKNIDVARSLGIDALHVDEAAKRLITAAPAATAACREDLHAAVGPGSVVDEPPRRIARR